MNLLANDKNKTPKKIKANKWEYSWCKLKYKQWKNTRRENSENGKSKYLNRSYIHKHHQQGLKNEIQALAIQ